MSRFDSALFDERALAQHEAAKTAFITLEKLLETIPCRATSTAMLRLDESFLAVEKAIREAQNARRCDEVLTEDDGA